MAGLTIAEAARQTGWSPRMLRYLEAAGVVEPARSGGRYRLYGPRELELLRRLRDVRERFDLAITDLAFAARLRRDPELRATLDELLVEAPLPVVPDAPPAWLDWEQAKHERLLPA